MVHGKLEFGVSPFVLKSAPLLQHPASSRHILTPAQRAVLTWVAVSSSCGSGLLADKMNSVSVGEAACSRPQAARNATLRFTRLEESCSAVEGSVTRLRAQAFRHIRQDEGWMLGTTRRILMHCSCLLMYSSMNTWSNMLSISDASHKHATAQHTTHPSAAAQPLQCSGERSKASTTGTRHKRMRTRTTTLNSMDLHSCIQLRGLTRLHKTGAARLPLHPLLRPAPPLQPPQESTKASQRSCVGW